MEFEPRQLRISDILHAIYKHRLLIVIMTIVGLIAGIGLSFASYMRGEMAKKYAINTSVAIITKTRDGNYVTRNKYPSSADYNLAEDMVDSVIYLLKSDRTMNATLEELGLVGIGPKDITGNLSISQYRETQIIEMTLYWRSAEEGVQILNAINSVASRTLLDVLDIGGISVVNNPTARYLIGGNMNASMWVIMAAVSFFGGICISVLELLLHPTLLNTKDISKTLGLEILGEIPFNKKYFSQKHSLLVTEENDIGEDVHLSYATAAHIISNRLGKERNQCLYITSAAANEGKTQVAANLAVQLSDLEKKVLLIDFDVRNPSIGSLFVENLDYDHSINAVYRGDIPANEAIIQLSGFLDLLPSILDRQEIPLDEAMMDIVRDLAQNYDYVLMDTAPIGQTADTMSLNRIASTALFVIRHDYTNMNDIQESLEILDKSGIRILGCIANGVKQFNGESTKQRPYAKQGPRTGSSRMNTMPAQEVSASRNIVTAADIQRIKEASESKEHDAETKT